ncbi:Cadherin-5 Vascular endothelial cadherin [Collichthys lucidus]|uniref:Cadherin-5 n=1 Tax=Collichthys lucidus TaxID=240159 RepID=A0A4U5VDB1_COLLU|nr:Cadherin-5 Vascular endothelial cadherin [Collichthys lucidus]
MMARLQLWTTALLVAIAASVSLAAAEDSGLSVVGAETQHPAEIVKKESHPILFRRKRAWLWNSIPVEEERSYDAPLKIGKLRSDKQVTVKIFELEGEGANTIFIVDENGDLYVNRTLDREEKSEYHLTAKMYDGNHKLIEDDGKFVVHVSDINDNAPVFPGTYNGSINERSPIGSKVAQVKATDADDPTSANGQLRYSLIQDYSAFKINDVTGEITCRVNTLDRETRSQYVVVVKAQDLRGKDTGSTATTSVTINVEDINDNIASFTRRTYELQVPENHRLHEKIDTLELEDRDEKQNKQPRFTIPSDTFDIKLSRNNDGDVILKKELDYETKSSYSFTVQVRENLANLRYPADNVNSAVTAAQVNIKVLDVDEPPSFTRPIYHFTVEEERMVTNIGAVTAIDPDEPKKRIRYSILDRNCPIIINPTTGQLSTREKLDRELEATHVFQVKAQEEPNGLESFVKVNITVKDINDNKPELSVDEIFICENDHVGTVIGTLRATDKDDQPASFTFSLDNESSNFSIRDYGNNTADLVVKMGPFSMDDPQDYSVDVRISDGGRPVLTSVTKLAIKSCRCDANRMITQCKASPVTMGVSVQALIAILLCILTILVIVILFVMRKRLQKDSLVSMKHSGEIHEQLVTYDEEGGGEMDTNGYDVSILSSACHDGSLLRRPDHHPHPSLYARVQKTPQPTACKGDMAVMIEVKKGEADHDRDGFPYDTLHIYGYEGPESLAGSLSSLDSSSTGSNLDYDFLSDWGPRFRSLAELYGVDGPEYYHQY